MRGCPPAPMEGMSAGAVGQARHSVTAWRSQIFAVSEVKKWPDLFRVSPEPTSLQL